MAERTQQMSEAETTLKLKEMEFERRVTSLQKEHASKVATVLQQATAVAPDNRGSLQTSAGVLRTVSKPHCITELQFQKVNACSSNCSPGVASQC